MARSIVALAVFLCAAQAQEFPSTQIHVGQDGVSGIYGPPRPGPVIAGAPYSAEQVQEYARKMPDGTTSNTRNVIGRFARDAQGRTRAERAYKVGPYWSTEIYDPVAGVAYLIDDQAKVAHRMALRPYTPADARPAYSGQNDEDLGTQVVDGLSLKGRRVNGRALTIELWDSEELQVNVVTRSSNGYTTRMENLTRTAPDPARFRPPDGYTVLDEPAPFSMLVRAERQPL